MAGVKELQDVVRFGLAMGNALGEALEDGKLSMSDLFKVLPALMTANAALEGIGKVPEELKDLDESEYQGLVAEMKAEFNLENDDMEAKIEKAYEVALKVAQLAAMFMKK